MPTERRKPGRPRKTEADACPSLPQSFLNFDVLPDNAFVRIDTVSHLQDCSIATVWRRVRRGDFPAPQKLSDKVTAGRVADVRKHLREVSA